MIWILILTDNLQYIQVPSSAEITVLSLTYPENKGLTIILALS